ncbi:Tip elongation aberrant protein 1 [Verticillium dahliae VDG2]|nr:Tip elongation aberrant protein 1 [Verticillium dahliae VDG2]
MSRVSAEDYSYLKQKGSFSLPKRDVLEDLLECYFDYIHPTMPFIDETEFWEIYHGRDADGQPSPPSHRTRISWLIFQAMLFAATTCASPELLRRAGYTSRMVARREAFFKVRTLYSLDIERDNMVLLQTFLLMSYWRGDAGEDKDAWHWSGLALSKAAGLGLHLQTSTPLTRRQETLRRRCWWSCVLRDRLVALSEQRPPRIQLDEFDVPLLTLADYNVGLRSPICKLSSGEELGKRTTLSMFSVQLIRLMLCSGRNPPSPSMDSQSASPGAAETWGRVSQPTRDDKRFTGFADLDYWMTNLPEVLQHSPRSHGSHGGDAVLPCILVHRSALHIYYHKLILSITMPRLLCPSGEESVRHLQLAQHSSAALAKLHNELVDHDSIHCLHSECFGSSTSSSGLEPLEGQATQMTNPTTFPAVAGTRFTYPLVTEQMTSGPALSDHDFTDSMVIDKWPQNFELTTRNTASSPSVDSILDAGSLFPWPLGDDETYSGMLPADVPDLEADRFSFSTVDTIQGPNGTHTCLVTAAASGSLSRSKRNSVSVPLNLHVARAIAAQLVLAVAYLHGNGIIHGDLHLGNILLTAPRGFELLCDEELREGWGGDRRASKLKPTTTSHFWTPSAFPSFATLPAFFGENSEEISLSDAAILLTEFGTFFCPSQETRPEKRCTVNEALQSEWMTKWAMPDFKRMRKELAAKKGV